MSDLNKIQSAQTIIVTDGISQEAAIGSGIPAGTEEALLVRDACVGQQTAANSRPVVIASNQSDVPVNIDKYGGTATTLGQKTMASSEPVVIASDQSNLPTNLVQVAGSAVSTAATGVQKVGIADSAGTSITVGQKAMASSVPVVIASDQSDVPVNIDKYGGTATTLGTKVAASSIPVTMASDQPDININVDKYGGTATTLGQKAMAASMPVTIASDQSAITVAQATAANLNAQVQGNVASGVADAGNPVKIGAVGHTAQPTAVTDGQRVDTVADKVGRLVVTNMQVRDLKTNNRTSISNTTETTVLAAVAATFLDITQIIITNTSNTKDANVDFRDSTGGTIRVTIHAPALATVVVNFADILTQATVNNNWTATSDSSSATLAITVLAIKNI